MKHIVCFSQGHSSALVAVEVVRRYGKENVILLNHAMNPEVEEADIRRFGSEVAQYLETSITYANYGGITDINEIPNQFEVAIKAKGFKAPRTTNAVCTNRLKTAPFQKYLSETGKDAIIYYGFDKSEIQRMTRRAGILGADGYKSDYPLITWTERTIHNTREIGIEPPNIYGAFKHANCTGCLKSGMQHWYVVYGVRPDLYVKASETENALGYTLNRKTINGERAPISLEELAPIFERMKTDGVPLTEHLPRAEFSKLLKKYSLECAANGKPCECQF